MNDLSAWFAHRCDGVWEQSRGVTIQTLDNPGWMLEVNVGAEVPDQLVFISGTPPGPSNGNIAEGEWTDCRIRGGKFVGASDAAGLRRLLEGFLEWSRLQ